jgi:GTP-binding protein
LIDTAGIRRSGKIEHADIEEWSVMRSERAISRCDIAAVVLDIDEGITHGDKTIIARVLEAQK